MASQKFYRHGEGNRRGPISPLRQRMINDMSLAGLAAATQKNYIEAVIRLQRRVGIRPDRLTEGAVRKYLVELRDVEGVAKGTFQTNFYGLKFFFYRVLDRDWSLFVKKRWPFRARSVFRLLCPLRIAAA